ncbi:hypothetical protein RB653_002918 [Dictyostelium firmibasis]|uniref:WD40 repeat-containing protein n=1 Tax=Dictyostelium firmibasis TaxID=79012 RepID=A0AAN7YZ33_9MYCE
MQYVNGNDISSQSIHEVLELSLSTKIPWIKLENESTQKHIIYSYSSNDRGIYLNKGVAEFNISPENMYELLLDISSRHKWDFHCREARIIEEYDHLNHIIHLNFTNPLISNLDMNLYRSCKYDPQARLFVIAMRSIELEDGDVDQFECLPNGWVIQGLRGEKDRCKMIFVQQCHLRDIELQRIPGYKSFNSKEKLEDFQFLTLFPATVSGRLAKIFESIQVYISNNAKDIETKDIRISIMEKAEKEVNEMFGTTNPDYGWRIYLKKLDMEILIKKTSSGYYMIGKGSFSSVFSPELLADVLYQKNPFEWDTFYDKTQLIESINDTHREVEVHYRMWRNSISMRLLQSVKKGPGNFSSVHWRSICSPNYQVVDGIEVHYLPTALLNYGLGEGSFTSFLAAIEVKGYPTPWEEEMVTKMFAARIISNQNSIINHVNKLTNFSKMPNELPVIPSVKHHCGDVVSHGGTPQNYNAMVETFADILLDENNKEANVVSSKNKRKRNKSNRDDDNGENENRDDKDKQDEDDEKDDDEYDEEEEGEQEKEKDEENKEKKHQEKEKRQQKKQEEKQQLPKKETKQPRPSIRFTNLLSNSSSEQRPIAWNESKKQPFLFLVSDSSERKGKIQRKTYYFSNSGFDNLPEEVVQIIFSNLSAINIINLSLVCKRFKMATDSPVLWRNLYKTNPLFHKKTPQKKQFILSHLCGENRSNEESADSADVADGSSNQEQQQQQPAFNPSSLNPNDPISILMMFTNGLIPQDLSPTDMINIGGLISQIDLGDLSNIGTLIRQLPPQILSLIQLDALESKIQQLTTMLNLTNGMPATIAQESPNKISSDPPKPNVNQRNNDSYIPDEEFINWKSHYTEKHKQSKRWVNMEPNRITKLLGHHRAIKAVKSEGNSAITVSTERKIKFWNLNTGQCIGGYEGETGVVSVEYDHTQKSSCIWPLSDYTKVHIGYKNGTVCIVDFIEQPIEAIHTAKPTNLADGFDFTYPGKYLIWDSSIIHYWNVETSTLLWTEPATHTKKITQAKIVAQNELSNNGIIFTTSSDRTAKIWDLVNGTCISTLTGHSNAVNCIESIGDYMALTASSDKTLKLWDLRQTTTYLCNYHTNHTAPIRCISYQEKNGIVLSGSDDGSIIAYNLDNWNLSNISVVKTPIFDNSIIGNNTTTTTTSTNSNNTSVPEIPKITLGTFKESKKLLHHNSAITCIESDEAGFISGSHNGLVLRWDF